MPSLLISESTILLLPLLGLVLSCMSKVRLQMAELSTCRQGFRGRLGLGFINSPRVNNESCKGLFTRREGNPGSWVTLALTR